MSLALGRFLLEFNVERLEIKHPVLQNFDNSIFQSLYQAISASRVTQFTITLPIKRFYPAMIIRPLKIPLLGIQSLSNSNIKSFELNSFSNYRISQFPRIWPALPRELKELKVRKHINVKLEKSDGLELNRILSHLPMLSSLQLKDINLEENGAEIHSLISGAQLTSLILDGSPIMNRNLFRIICRGIPGSHIETLKIINPGFHAQNYINDLIEVIGVNVVPLRHFVLHGQSFNKTKLISVLQNTQIESLGLVRVELNNEEVGQLAHEIPLTNLKRLDIRYNSLNSQAIGILKSTSSLHGKLEITVI